MTASAARTIATGELAKSSGWLVALIHLSKGRIEPSEPSDRTSMAAARSATALIRRVGRAVSPISQKANAASVAPRPMVPSRSLRS